jgi:O-antigen ligase
MIRYAALVLVLTAIMAYAWKDWFRALCLLVVMVAVLERPDMPAAMLGIPGLNPFNVGLGGILLAWGVVPSGLRRGWDGPRWFNVLLSLLACVVLVGFARLLADPSYLLSTGAGTGPNQFTPFGLVAEFGLNSFKWVIPGLLIFQGCRSKEDHRWAAVCLVTLYLVLAVQTIRQMPLSYLLDGEALEERAARVLAIRLGYHRVELAGVFAGVSWAMLSIRPLFLSRITRLGLLGMSAATVLALALTGGRTGYGVWVLVGLLLAGLRWRRALIVGPIAVLLLIGYAPGISQRLLQGISYDKKGEATAAGETDLYTVTAGRSVLWPYVLESIRERPIVGYGREAFNRNGLRQNVFLAVGEDFGHPHNGYFQFALDNGMVGLSVLLALFVTLLLKSVTLFRRSEPQATAAGGMALSFLTSFLAAAVGAQTFYPTELSTGLWCAIGLLMRACVELPASKEATVRARRVIAVAARIPRLSWGTARTGSSSALRSTPPRPRIRWNPNRTSKLVGPR